MADLVELADGVEEAEAVAALMAAFAGWRVGASPPAVAWIHSAAGFFSTPASLSNCTDATADYFFAM